MDNSKNKGGLRVATEWLAKLIKQDRNFDSSADLLENEAVHAVAVALGRDVMEVAYKTSILISKGPK